MKGTTKMETIAVSIIVPCYNCENTIEKCVNSILEQTLSNIEIILINDGSTDSTFDICNKYASYPNIKVLNQENQGLMHAWKSGVEISAGQYIGFCDSDDYINADMCKTLFDVAQKYNVDLVLAGISLDYENKNSVKIDNMLDEGKWNRKQIENEIIPNLLFNGRMESLLILASRGVKLYKKELLLKCIGDLPNKISLGEDILTCFSVLCKANSLYCIKNFYPYHYVRNNSSMIGVFDPFAYKKIEDLYYSFVELAKRYLDYSYEEQINSLIFSRYILWTKKNICRNEKGLKSDYDMIRCGRESEVCEKICQSMNICRYSFAEKIFAKLFIQKRIKTICILTRIANKLGMGKK